MSDDRKPLRRQWAIVHHYHDNSAILRAWGPFSSEAAANEWNLPEHMGTDAMTVVELLEPVQWSDAAGGDQS